MRAKTAGVALERHRAMHSAVASCLNSALPDMQASSPSAHRHAPGDQQHLNRMLCSLDRHLLVPCICRWPRQLLSGRMHTHQLLVPS